MKILEKHKNITYNNNKNNKQKCLHNALFYIFLVLNTLKWYVWFHNI